MYAVTAVPMMPVVMVSAAALCLWCAARSGNRLQLGATCVMFAAMFDHAIVGLVAPALWAALLVCAGLITAASLRPAGGLGVGRAGDWSAGFGADRGAAGDGDPTCDGGAAVGLWRSPGPAAAPATLSGARVAHGILTALSYPAMGALLLVSAAPRSQPAASPLAVTAAHNHGGAPSVGWLLAAVVVLSVALATAALAAARGGRRLAAVDAGAMTLMLGAMLA
ncbi:hypothetical protein ACF07D_01030 [Leucobacter sp. NPDC015123]|uniref:hypothetical protein n=1 Tax=Leucobacter sp. NPDC015123 TaxID=3364129 RepID=UPI0036F46A1F